VPFKTAIINSVWAASNLPSYWRFLNVLPCDRRPVSSQNQKLEGLLRANERTAFGKTHGFAEIKSHADFKRRVPISDYAGFEPWIRRIQDGETNVLTSEPVTHLIPTSGSSGGRKLIPFTAGLQREFNAGIGPWLIDLIRQFPSILGGRAYWSITPSLGERSSEPSAIPIGFDADTAYLGDKRQKLAEAVMAVPANAHRAPSLDQFRYQTLLHLLLCPDLRLISVWHPSFFTLLLDALPDHWNRLLNDIEKGSPMTKPNPGRARELLASDPVDPQLLWPSLQVISCWSDAAAALPAQQLRRRFPHAFLQPKGLLATEGFVTLPFAGKHPLAITSHFFEFLDDRGTPHMVDGLRTGQEYEVVLTTAGGLWRYRLGDRVRVTRWLGAVPSLEFLGRTGIASDLFGEKVSEEFVVQLFSEIFNRTPVRFALLAPDRDEEGCRYTLYLEGPTSSDLTDSLERGLRRNPHYAYCRDLGQLLPVRLFEIHSRGYESYIERQSATGARLGDIKPAALSRAPGWSQILQGRYADPVLC